MLVCSLLGACSDSNEAESDYAQPDEVYMNMVGEILQNVRALNDRIEVAIPDGNVDLAVAADLVYTDFKPTLIALRQRTLDLSPQPRHEAVHQKLLGYLDLRLSAYEAILQARLEADLSHLARFPQLEAEADSLGAAMESELRHLRYR